MFAQFEFQLSHFQYINYSVKKTAHWFGPRFGETYILTLILMVWNVVWEHPV